MWGYCYLSAREINPDFVGPTHLLRLTEWQSDTQTENRLETYNKGTRGVWGCTLFLLQYGLSNGRGAWIKSTNQTRNSG